MDENTRLILAAIENLGKNLSAFKEETNARFEAIDKRFEAIDKRFEEMESFQETMFAAVQADIAALKADVARVESKIVPPDKVVDQFIDSFNEGKITVQLKKAI